MVCPHTSKTHWYSPRSAVSLWLWSSSVRPVSRTFTGGLTRSEPLNQAYEVGEENLTLTRLFFCQDSWAEDQVPRSLGAQARGLTISFFYFKNFTAPEMSSPFWVLLFFILFFQRGFGSQLSCQGAPEISQGSLKAGGQRPLPRSEQRGGFVSSSLQTDLIKANDKKKKKLALCKSTHVQTRHPTQQWFTSPSRLAKTYGARDI